MSFERPNPDFVKVIGWSVDEDGCGYTVTPYDGQGNPVSHRIYRAGNHVHDSQSYVDKDSPNALSRDELVTFAKQTALRFAEEWGLDVKNHYVIFEEDKGNRG